MSPKFSLVIPCYNEAASIPELVQRAAFVAELGDGEVILVNNGSTDASAQVLSEHVRAGSGVRIVTVEVNQGYGFGILSGLAVAEAPIVGWTHADLQTDPADAVRALAVIDGIKGPVFVKGRRYGRPTSDIVFTAGMSLFETILLRAPLRDINAQPTMFSRELLEGWGEPPTDFALDLFAMYRAQRAGYRIVRFPVLFAPRRHGVSSWNTDFAAKRRFIRRTIDFSLALRKKL